MIDRLLPAAIVFLPLAALAWLLLRRTRPVMWFAIACLAVGTGYLAATGATDDIAHKLIGTKAPASGPAPAR